ncbi:TPA: GpE family phage tail protein [Mannheimia haemolytica]|uniref:GpE family phage tail protein n=1 Tax=Mannheimia haemolytica TaxID=75985 RepID=A0A547ES04_MANHA|nr:GpE family phage tail protein [Mannheimia haemolytica]ASW16664.1 GpE family phage tail protein [Mannheimia haemolytica USDA-ARS-USMARC-183]ASW16757.1 GpE family phage tail protein [Mannheimia haemolytica USDA-ARS-USMARC-184]AWW72170.1 GpE family phage tail protein [Pasteurellaceae bacterium 12565]ASW37143.1 GpE family phage tail protein [Mannheimia haemolytica]ASW66971.1 GpE family phage tail protein [Mannheimia haemolytica]
MSELDTVYADLAWWFKFSPSELLELDLVDIPKWVEQMNRQIKAGYGQILR